MRQTPDRYYYYANVCSWFITQYIKCYVIHQQCKDCLHEYMETFWDVHRKSTTVHLQSVETRLMKRQSVDVIITDRRVITMTRVDNCALTDNEEYCNYSKSGHSIIIAHLWRRRLGTACPWEPHTWDELASGRHNGCYWWCSAGPSCCWHFFSHSQCGLLID